MKAKGDGSDPHGESLLGNGASSQDAGDTVSSGGGTKFTSRDLRRVMTCLIRIISCGLNNITQKLYQPIGTN